MILDLGTVGGAGWPSRWRRIFLIFREPPSEIVRRTGDGAMGGLVLGGGVVNSRKNLERSGTGDGVFGRRTRKLFSTMLPTGV